MASKRLLRAKEIAGMKKILLAQEHDLKQATLEALNRAQTDEELNRVAITIHVLFNAAETETNAVMEEHGPLAGIKAVLKANEAILEHIKALP